MDDFFLYHIKMNLYSFHRCIHYIHRLLSVSIKFLLQAMLQVRIHAALHACTLGLRKLKQRIANLRPNIANAKLAWATGQKDTWPCRLVT